MTKGKRSLPPFYIAIICFALGLFIATLLHSGKFLAESPSKQGSHHKIVFTLQNTPYALAELPYAEANALYNLEQQQYDQKLQILRSAALRIHLDNLAAKRGVSRDIIQQELISVIPVSDEDVTAFYEANRDRINQPFHQVRDAIRHALERDRANRAQTELVEQLLDAGQIDFHLQLPTAPTVDLDLAGFAAQGPETAPVVIADFMDYRCPHCKIASETLLAVQQEFPQQVRLVVLDLPILGEVSDFAARAAYCAASQKVYWEMHHALLEAQQELDNKKVLEIAENLGMDRNNLDNCIDSKEANLYVNRAVEQAKSLGLSGTPAVFINGMAFRGANLEAALRDAVRDAIAASR